MESRASRYALPLSTLVAGAQVPLDEQVTVQAEVPPPPWTGSTRLPFAAGGGADVDGDGE